MARQRTMRLALDQPGEAFDWAYAHASLIPVEYRLQQRERPWND